MTIFQPNLTFWTDGNKGGPAQAGYQIQSPNWMYDAAACGRPPTEVQQTIICGTCFVTNPATFYLTGSAGGDFDRFAACCNSSASAHQATNNRTVYYSSSSCGEFCLTNDTAVADNWDKCVTDAAQNYTSSSNTSLSVSYCGRCEYLNKDFLKSALQNSAAASAPKGMTALLLAGLVVVGALAL